MIRASYSLKIFPNFNEEEVDLSVSRHFIYISLLTRVNYRNIYLYFNSHVTVCGNTEEYFLHNTRCA